MQIDDRSRIDAANAERRIAGAFKAASDATGTSFGYLLSTSGRESDYQPNLGSTSSTAKGLFQFLDQTWLELVKKQGASVGLERYADAIASDGKGGWTVADPKMKARILALRADPLVSSVMAGRFTQENAQKLTETLGRKPTEGELYAAHVLGPAGATKLIRLAGSEPGSTAAVSFPKAAAANPGLFYDKAGRPKTVSELLGRLTGTTTAADPQIARRIAEEHAAIARTAAQPVDPATVARLVKAQAAAQVAGEPLGSGEAATDPAAALAHSRRILADRPIPGASGGEALGASGALTGWRAKATTDAFSLLMRTDPAGGADETADGVAALAGTLPGDHPASGRALVAIAEARAQAKTPGVNGGIPWVDPNAPLRLDAAAAAPAPAPAAAAAAAQAAPAYRPSRLMNRAVEGAPTMPLPMVDAARGATQPSRLLFAEEAPRAAPDAVRVTTASIPAATAANPATTPSAAAASAAITGRTITVPVTIATAATPTGTATLTTTTVAAADATPAASASAAAPRRAPAPLDLVDLSRRRPTR
jgi:hypothetical protein